MLLVAVVIVSASVAFASGGSGGSGGSSGGGTSTSAPSGATGQGSPTGSTPGQPFGSPTGSTPGQPFGSPTGSTPGQPFGSPTGSTPGQSFPNPMGPVPSQPTANPAFPGTSPARHERHIAARRLRRQLLSDPELANFDLRIIPFGGRFVIQGNVDTQQEKDLITQRAAAIAGNGNVDNEVAVGLFSPPAGPSGRSADRKLARDVRRAVFTDPIISGIDGDVRIFASNGRVVLQGRVRSDQEKSLIEQKAGAIAGSSNVDDQLAVFP